MANNAFRNNADYWLASPTTADNQKPAWVPYVQLSDDTGVAQGTIDAPLYSKAAPYTVLGYQQILSATLATSQALTVPTGATVATIQNNSTGTARWRPDGATTAPTSTTGQTIAAGATLTLDTGAAGLASARFIIGSGTVILDICYFS